MSRSITQLSLSITVFENLGSHPPWHCLSSHEVADLLGISVGTVWNWTLRGHGLIPEIHGMHVRASTRRFFFPCLILEWLAEREGEPVPAVAWIWIRAWLAARHLLHLDTTPGELLVTVKAIDKVGVYRRRWKVQRDLFEARLAEVLVVEDVAAPHGRSAAEQAGRLCG